MKKFLYCIPFLGIMISCSGEQKSTEAAPEAIQEQIKGIDESIQKLDESIKSSESELDQTQDEIDSLLQNI